jgi:hypothetical protein
MGVAVGLEPISGAHCPYWFTRSDSKMFYRHVISAGFDADDPPYVMQVIAEKGGIDLKPLGVYASGTIPRDQLTAFFPALSQEEREAAWHENEARNAAAWQPPQNIIQVMMAAIAVLEATRTLFNELEMPPWEQTRDYLLNGTFEQDLRDFLYMAEWAAEQGNELVRIRVDR